MKNIIVIPFIFLLLISSKSFSQIDKLNINSDKPIIRCGSDEYNEKLRQQYPNMMGSKEYEDWLRPKIEAFKASRLLNPDETNVVLTIPVVVHVLNNGEAIGTGPNITDTQVQSQITVMNIDYRNLAGSIIPVAADVEVEFCLAQQDPNGLPTNGIDRVNIGQNGITETSLPDAQNQMNALKPSSIWDPSKYMNMWSVAFNGGSGLLGYAQFPGGPANTDGVVSDYRYFGSSDYDDGSFILSAPFDKGRTMTHEVGHFLGLFHTFQDGTCTDDYLTGDLCADTPGVATANYNCPTGTDSCPTPLGNPDMIENYMDYTDDACMNTFTVDQKARIVTVLNNSTNRMELTTSIGCDTPVIYDLDGQIDFGSLNIINCGSTSITPEIIITNHGNNTLTSGTIDYYIDSETPVSYNWTGSLAIGEFDTVALPVINLTLGAHTFNAELIDPNGGTDEQPANNVISTNINITGANCSSVGTTTYATSTEGVVFNTISNLNSGKPSGYSDYTASSTDVNINSAYDLSIYANSDGNYQIITYVWIDWNQNCNFDDAGEQYDLGTSANIVNDLTTNSPLSITIPSGASLGNTTMRVTTKYTDPGSNQFPTSCENGHDAEVEDYTINVMSALSLDDYYLNSLSIYPNPVTDKLTIKVSNSYTPDSYKIYNMVGQLVAQKSVNNLSDLKVNTSSLSDGVYFIKISKDNSSSILKFLKN